MNSLKLRPLQPWETGVVFSLLFHAVIWQALSFKSRSDALQDFYEVDLTRPFRLTSDPLKAHRAENPSPAGRIVDNPAPAPLGEKPAAAPAKPQDWTLPGPKTKVLDKLPVEETPVASPAGTETGTGPGYGGRGGTGDGGEVDWVYLTTLPKLLNKDELIRNMQKFYPENERRTGKEGRVILSVHLDENGRVTGAEVEAEGSAGSAFDEAARKIISFARFSPAKVHQKPVRVKVLQAVDFQLQ